MLRFMTANFYPVQNNIEVNLIDWEDKLPREYLLSPNCKIRNAEEYRRSGEQTRWRGKSKTQSHDPDLLFL